MKLTNFEPTIAPNNIQGQGNAISVPSDPRAFGADTSGLEGMGKVLGIGLKMAEDAMTADVTKAMTEYQRRMDDLQYNPEKGLAYLKNENARNVTQQYIEGEKKIREEVFQMVPKYKKAQDLFNQKADELTANGIETSNKQQYEQSKNYSLAVMNDAVEQAQISMGHNLGNEKLIDHNIKTIRSVIAANGNFMGAQWAKDKQEEVLGKSVADMLAQAKADDNQEAIDKIINRYGPMVNPAYIREYIANNNQQKKTNFMINSSKDLATKYRNDPEGLKKAIDGMTMDEPTTGNLGARIVSQIEANHIGDSSYMEDGSGTTCVYSPTVAANEVDPDIPVMTDTGTLMTWGKNHGILKGADYLANVQPGDMIIINDPSQSNDADHNFVWTGHGIYNAGGKGGSSYEEEFSNPQDTLSYFGSGVTVAGIVAFSQLNGGGSGPAKKRALTPAEKEKMYAMVQKEIATMDAEDRKKKQDSLKAFDSECAELATSGVYEESQYIAICRKYQGVNGLSYGELYSRIQGYIRKAKYSAGISTRGSASTTAAGRAAFKEQVAEAMGDGRMNDVEVDAWCVANKISEGSWEWKTAHKMNDAILTSGIDMQALKWKANNTKGVDWSSNYAYMLDRLSEIRSTGKQPSFDDAWEALTSGGEKVILHTSDGDYETTKGRIYRSSSAYNYNPDTGVAYLAGVNEEPDENGEGGASYISADEMHELVGGNPVEVDEDDGSDD